METVIWDTEDGPIYASPFYVEYARMLASPIGKTRPTGSSISLDWSSYEFAGKVIKESLSIFD